MAGQSVQGTLNTLNDPRDVVTEEPGVYVVAEKATVTNGDQTGEIRLFTQTIPGTSKKIIRGQFGASGVDILGNHGNLPGSTCIGGVCPGKRYVVSDIEIGKLFKLEKPVTLITGTSPNDAVTVGSGAQQQVWVAAGPPLDGNPCTTLTDSVMNVYNTREDKVVDVDGDPFNGTDTPINLATELGGPYCTPTSMAVVERDPTSLKPTTVYVTAFDSDVILVYDAKQGSPTQFQLFSLPISVGAGPRRIVIQPEIIEAP